MIIDHYRKPKKLVYPKRDFLKYPRYLAIANCRIRPQYIHSVNEVLKRYWNPTESDNTGR